MDHAANGRRSVVRRILAIFLALVCLSFGAISVFGAGWTVTVAAILAVGAMLACTFGPRYLDFYAPTAALAVVVVLPFCFGGLNQALIAYGLDWRTIFAIREVIDIVALLAILAALVHWGICHWNAPTRLLSKRGANAWACSLLIGSVVMVLLTAVFFDQGSFLWVGGAAATIVVVGLAIFRRSSEGLMLGLGLLTFSTAVGVLFAIPTTSEPVEFPAWWTWAETVGRGFMYLGTLALFSVAGRYRSAPDA